MPDWYAQNAPFARVLTQIVCVTECLSGFERKMRVTPQTLRLFVYPDQAVPTRTARHKKWLSATLRRFAAFTRPPWWWAVIKAVKGLQLLLPNSPELRHHAQTQSLGHYTHFTLNPSKHSATQPICVSTRVKGHSGRTGQA